MDGRRDPLAREGSPALRGRAVVFHFDLVDTADNGEDIAAVWTFIFILHSGKP